MENEEIIENIVDLDYYKTDGEATSSSSTHDSEENDLQQEYEYDYQYEDDEYEEYEDSDRKWSNINIPESIIEEEIEEIVVPSEPTEEELIKKDKQEKIEKLERSWPWADRHKVIYKQSSCHMVPRKPLGIVENRIKQLVQRNLEGVMENKHQI